MQRFVVCAGVLLIKKCVNDFGSNAVADKVILGGKLTILILSLPIIESVLNLISGFLELI